MTWNLTPLTCIYKYAALHDITMCLKENNWTYSCIYCFLLNHTSHYDPTKAWDQRNQEQVVLSIQSRNEMNCFRHYLTMRIVNPFSVITYNRYKRINTNNWINNSRTRLFVLMFTNKTAEFIMQLWDIQWQCIHSLSSVLFNSVLF